MNYHYTFWILCVIIGWMVGGDFHTSMTGLAIGSFISAMWGLSKMLGAHYRSW